MNILKSFFKPNTIYGSARFLKKREFSYLFKKNNDGYYINGTNRLNLKQSFENLGIIGSTGGGKGTCIVVPTLLNIDKVSIVATDPKGELSLITKYTLIKKNYKVKVLDFIDVYNSVRYDPLFRANSFTEIQKLAYILVDSAYPSTGDQAFWNDGAKNLLTILITCLHQKKMKTISNLQELLFLINTDVKKATSIIQESVPQSMVKNYESFINGNERTMLSILETAKTALNLFNDPNVTYLTSFESLCFETLREEKTAIFIKIPPAEVRYYSFILRIFYTQLFKFILSDINSSFPVLLVLDEFANMGKIPNMSNIASQIRGYNCGFMAILQDFEQLKATYGDDASSIWNGGINTKVFYPGLSLNTCKELEQILGKQTLKTSEYGFEKNNGTKSSRDKYISRCLMTVDEIRCLDQNQALLIHKNRRPYKMTMQPYFKNKELMSLIPQNIKCMLNEKYKK